MIGSLDLGVDGFSLGVEDEFDVLISLRIKIFSLFYKQINTINQIMQNTIEA